VHARALLPGMRLILLSRNHRTLLGWRQLDQRARMTFDLDSQFHCSVIAQCTTGPRRKRLCLAGAGSRTCRPIIIPMLMSSTLSKKQLKKKKKGKEGIEVVVVDWFKGETRLLTPRAKPKGKTKKKKNKKKRRAVLATRHGRLRGENTPRSPSTI
jgi:hypothetical protein